MYRILIADDEGIVRDSLKFIIEKNFSEECEVLLAKNGRQAIEEVENSRPDIAFLDIQMPGINGLKALEEMRALNSKVRTIILTAFDNFDYAKEALRLGAVDYLMKPINKKLIVERLSGLFQEIDKERKRRKEDLVVQEKMAAVVPIIENGFVLSLILQQEYQDSGVEYRSLMEIPEENGILFVLEWGEHSTDGIMENPVGSGIRGHRYYEKMAEIVKIYFRAYVSSTLGNKLVFVLPTEKEDLSYEERVSLIEKARNMIHALKQEVNADFRLGIGSVQPWDSAFESYQEALNALRHGKRSVTHIDDLIVKRGEEEQRMKMEQLLLRAVLGGLEPEARREAAVFASWVLRQEENPEARKLRLLELIFFLQRELENQGNHPELRREIRQELLSTENEEELRNGFIRICMDLCRSVVIRNPKSDTVISIAAEYIRKNFRKDLTQEDVAAQVGISPYYFSKLFKEEMGKNYTEYLTELRMEEAKRMLQNPNYSIKEVCVESGYTNPNYFSRIFKKWTGITPSEFREGAVLPSSGIEIE